MTCLFCIKNFCFVTCVYFVYLVHKYFNFYMFKKNFVSFIPSTCFLTSNVIPTVKQPTYIKVICRLITTNLITDFFLSNLNFLFLNHIFKKIYCSVCLCSPMTIFSNWHARKFTQINLFSKPINRNLPYNYWLSI